MKNMIAFLWIGWLLAGCAPAPLTPDVNALSTQAVSTAYAKLTQTALPTLTPTLPPISEALLPAECLQLDERLAPEFGMRENPAPWTKSASCDRFALSQDNQYLAYVHYTYNDSPEVVERCSNPKYITPEQCRADIGRDETIKILQVSTGETRNLITVERLSEAGIVLNLEWLDSGELRYRIGGVQHISADLTYDPATGLVSAITPTPFPTPGSPLPVQVKEQVYRADIAWSPDGKTLAIASCYAGCRLELLNPADLSLLWSVELSDSSTNLRFGPNGERIAVGEAEILLLHAQDGTVAWQTKLTDGSATRVEFSPNGENIAVLVESFTSAPNEIRFLDMRDGKISNQWKVGSAESFSYNPSGEQIVTSGEKLTLWNVSTGGLRWELNAEKFPAQSGACQVETFDRAMFSQNQDYLFAHGASMDSLGDFLCNALLALNLKTQKMVVLQPEPDPGYPAPPMSALDFDESTSELLVHQQYLGLQRWNVETQEITAVEQPGDFIFSNDFAQFAPMAQNGDFYFDGVLEFSTIPNQTWLALSVEAIGDGSGYEDFYLYDLSTGAWLDLFPSPYRSDWNEYSMQSPSLSPDGRWLAAINSNGKLRVWNMGFGLHSINTTVQPNATPTPSSTSAFSCPLAPNPRVKVGDTARITFTTGQRTRLRSAPEAGDNVAAMLAEGTEFKIVEGPICYPRPDTNQAYVYWKVSLLSTSQEGWLAEGDFDSYFIEPLP